MKLTIWQYGFSMLAFGMGLTLMTLYVLTWVMRILTSIFKVKDEA